MLAVTWGFHDKIKLNAAEPEYVVDNPQEILDILV
jgi:phosphoglycolate phosphatase-like HAD superfamily hydrolase